MSLAYAVIALGLLALAFVTLALGVIGVGAWVRWLRAAGPVIALVAIVVTGAAALNTLVPRGCDDGGTPSVQRPLLAALDSVGGCYRLGVGQVALVPVVAVAASLPATRRLGRGAPSAADRHPAATDEGPGGVPALVQAVGDLGAPVDPAHWRLGRRAELDGVRGLAVLAVLLGHAGLPGVPKIHIYGVGLFFVLSGFLITTLLLEERADRGSIRLRSFYLRRAYRLGPALVVFVLAIAIATFGFGAFDTGEVTRGARNTLLYVVNYAKIDGQDMGPLAHLWSLSVEEHFYLVWPAVTAATLGLARRHPLRWLTALAATGLVTSVALTLLLLDQGAYLRAENSTETRASGMIAGCLLALWFHSRPAAAPTFDRRAGTVVAAGALAALAALSTDRWFGPLGELPVELAAVSLIGALVLAPSACNRALRWSPLARVGRLSYALYLWHYPVFLLVGGELRTMSVWETVAASALSLGIAELSMSLVERPFLDRRHRTRVRTEPDAPTTRTTRLVRDALAGVSLSVGDRASR